MPADHFEIPSFVLFIDHLRFFDFPVEAVKRLTLFCQKMRGFSPVKIKLLRSLLELAAASPKINAAKSCPCVTRQIQGSVSENFHRRPGFQRGAAAWRIARTDQIGGGLVQKNRMGNRVDRVRQQFHRPHGGNRAGFRRNRRF